jgi:hypothetical protein
MPFPWRDALMNDDLSHIKILSIFHYVVAAIAALFACFPFIHLFIGISMLTGSFFQGGSDQALPFPFSLFGLIFTVVPAAIILIGWAFAICMAFAGYFLSKKQRYTFCLVMAGISCIFTPFGTVLGVFTIIVLMSPSVKELFKTQLQTHIG